MTSKKIKSSVESVQAALTKLNEALEHLKAEKEKTAKGILEDGAVKRFETLFEYSWKALKVAVEFEGGEAPGPRPAIQEAIKFGWIKDVDIWMSALDTRNATVHDYFFAAPKNYIEVIRKFATEVDSLLQKLSLLGH